MTLLASRRRGFTLIQLLVVLAILAVLAATFFPATRSVRPAVRRTQCRNNLKQIGLALHNYAEIYGAFPPACTVDADGKPLHSWRTLLLPYLDQKPLYDTIDLSKAWNDPVNAGPLQTRIHVYACPASGRPATETTYLAIITPKSCLRPGQPRVRSEITDSASETLMVIDVDAAHAVPWMAPTDADEALWLGIGAESRLSHSSGVQGLLADGSVRFFVLGLPADTRRALVTVDGRDKVTLDE